MPGCLNFLWQEINTDYYMIYWSYWHWVPSGHTSHFYRLSKPIVKFIPFNDFCWFKWSNVNVVVSIWIIHSGEIDLICQLYVCRNILIRLGGNWLHYMAAIKESKQAFPLFFSPLFLYHWVHQAILAGEKMKNDWIYLEMIVYMVVQIEIDRGSCKARSNWHDLIAWQFATVWK